MSAIWGAAVSPLVTYVLSILGLAMVAVYAIFRLNSTQIIREKVWSAFVGDKDFNDEKLQSFAHDQLDLTRFRVVYGVQARSVADLHRLLSWMERYRFTPIEIKRVRRRIDPSRAEPLNAPSRRFLVACLVVIAITIASFMYISNKATTAKTTMIHMRVSKTWMWSDGASVEGIGGTPWRIDAQACSQHTLPDTSTTGLTSNETTAICNGISDGELKATVKEGLTYQRWSGVLISFLILFAGINVGISAHIGLLARGLAQRLPGTGQRQAGRRTKKPARSNNGVKSA